MSLYYLAPFLWLAGCAQAIVFHLHGKYHKISSEISNMIEMIWRANVNLNMATIIFELSPSLHYETAFNVKQVNEYQNSYNLLQFRIFLLLVLISMPTYWIELNEILGNSTFSHYTSISWMESIVPIQRNIPNHFHYKTTRESVTPVNGCSNRSHAFDIVVCMSCIQVMEHVFN